MAVTYKRNRTTQYADAMGLEKMVVCEECGAMNRRGSAVCSNCGARNFSIIVSDTMLSRNDSHRSGLRPAQRRRLISSEE